MAQNQTPAFFAVALLLIAAATPLAVAQAPPAIPVVCPFQPTVGSVLSSLTVNGNLCCTPNFSCPGGIPIVGAYARLYCGNPDFGEVVGSAISDFNGNFSITAEPLISYRIQELGPLAAIVGGQLPCIVNMLYDSCPFTYGAYSLNIGYPIITGLLLGENGIHAIATLMYYPDFASAPV